MQLKKFPSRREFSVLELPSVWMVENFVLLLNFVLTKFKTWSSGKAMAPYSITLAWKIPWMEEPGGLQSMMSPGDGHD